MSSFFRTLFFSKISKSVTVHYSHWWLNKGNRLVEKASVTISKRNLCTGTVCGNETLSINQCKETNYVRFDDMIASRREEARRSILVQVQSESSVSDLYSYCKQFGIIKTLHYYSMHNNHFILVEFNEEASVKAVLEHGTHLNSEPVIPVRSPLLWFRITKKMKKTLTETSPQPPMPIPYSTQKLQIPEKAELYKLLFEAESVSDQMTLLYDHSKMNDIGSRLRFLSARQLELMLEGVFPHIRAVPFGSSVNSFGKIGCDLDLVLLFDELQERQNSRLVFQAKTSLNKRTSTQRQIEVIGDLMQLFLPGCSQVKKISQARVPIVKYQQDLTFIDCDVSVDNMTAIYMSELLYLFGHIDWRVRPLVFNVRWWAKETMLTDSLHPGNWITNFSLTLLVIFFLQRIKILPPLDYLVQNAGVEDNRVSEDGVNCTFLRDLSKLAPSKSKDSRSLAELLFYFFEFYAAFDFTSKAVSINIGAAINKPERIPSMYIVNPLERLLNVSKNVSKEETGRFCFEARDALSRFNPKADEGAEQWGLLSLVRNRINNSSQKAFFDYFKTPLKSDKRLISVEELFGEEADSGISTASNTAGSGINTVSNTADNAVSTESDASSVANTTDENTSISKKTNLPKRTAQMKKRWN